jgi:phosphatidylcholine synthase
MRWPWPVNAALTFAATAAMFAPVVFVHPLRVRRLRPLTIAATIVWFALAAVAIVEGLEPQIWVKIGLAALAAYFLLLPLARRPIWPRR